MIPLLGVFLTFIAMGLAWLGFVAIRGMYRFYRDNRPNRYRVIRSRWEDSRPVDSRDIMAAHWRMVGKK